MRLRGVGTAGTWESYLGGIKNTTYPNSINGVSIPNVQNTTGGTFTETYNSAQHVSLENTDRQIVANGDEANAILSGKFQVTCATATAVKYPALPVRPLSRWGRSTDKRPARTPSCAGRLSVARDQGRQRTCTEPVHLQRLLEWLQPGDP